MNDMEGNSNQISSIQYIIILADYQMEIFNDSMTPNSYKQMKNTMEKDRIKIRCIHILDMYYVLTGNTSLKNQEQKNPLKENRNGQTHT